MIGYVYTLSPINSDDVFYVGCTSKNLHSRLVGHNGCVKFKDAPVYRHIRDNNITIKIDLLERVLYKNKNTLLLAEEYWIEQLRQWGFCLKNKGNSNPLRFSIRNPLGSSSISVDKSVLLEAKAFCKAKGVYLNDYVNDSLIERLRTIKQINYGT